MSTPGRLQRRGVLAHRGGRLLGERVVALDQRHEPRARDREHVGARVERAHELLVAAARDGRLRREQADPAVARRLDGRVRLGRDHADDRHPELGLELGQRGRGRRVAGDDDQLDALRLEEQADLAGEAAQLVERARAVRQPGAVAEVDEVLVRERDEALVQHRQAAHARVEHADRPLVHARDCREAMGRLPCRPCFAACSSSSLARARPRRAGLRVLEGGRAADDGRRRRARATRSTRPDGAAPAGGWPGVVVLHGLAGNRGTVDAVATSFATRGYAVLAYDARGHGASGGVVTLAGPREVADLRARPQRLRRPPRGERHEDRRLGHLVRRRPDLERARRRACRSRPPRWSRRGRRSTTRSGRRTSRARASSRGFAASVAARSPLITSLRDDAVQSTNPAAIRAAEPPSARRSRRPRSIRTPVYLFQGRTDFAFDISQATRAFARLAGPKRLYVGNFGHAPSTFPAPTSRSSSRRADAWFDRTSRDATPASSRGAVVIARAGTRTPDDASRRCRRRRRRRSRSAGRSTRPRRPPSPPGRRRRCAPRSRRWGGGTATVTVPKLARYPRLVVTVLAGPKVVAHGGLRPQAGVNRVRLANYCVYVPKGTRLRVTVGPSSPAGQFAYLGFAGLGLGHDRPDHAPALRPSRSRSPDEAGRPRSLALVLASTAGAAVDRRPGRHARRRSCSAAPCRSPARRRPSARSGRAPRRTSTT